MSRTGDQEHVDVIAHDEPVEMCVNHVDARTGSPMPEQTLFNMPCFQWLPQKHVPLQVDLRGSQVVGGPLIASQHLHLADLLPYTRTDMTRTGMTRLVVIRTGVIRTGVIHHAPPSPNRNPRIARVLNKIT